MYPGVVQYWVKIVFANKLCQLYTILCVLCLYSVLRRAILVRYFLVLCSRHLRACFLNSSSNSSRSLFLGMLPTKRRWLLWDMVTPILFPFCSSLSFSWKCTTVGGRIWVFFANLFLKVSTTSKPKKNAKLSQQRFWPCHLKPFQNGFNATPQPISGRVEFPLLFIE